MPKTELAERVVSAPTKPKPKPKPKPRSCAAYDANPAMIAPCYTPATKAGGGQHDTSHSGPLLGTVQRL